MSEDFIQTIIEIMQYTYREDTINTYFVNKDAYNNTKVTRNKLKLKGREILYDEDTEEEVFRKWYPDGKLAVKSYYGLYGIHQEWYPDGQVKYDVKLYNSEFHGEFKLYQENGDMDQFYNFKFGKEHGECLDYHTNGKIKRKHNYLAGKKHGQDILWDIDGNEIGYEYYRYGQNIKWDSERDYEKEKNCETMGTCKRCGRRGHIKKECSHYHDIEGDTITNDNEFEEKQDFWRRYDSSL